MPAVTPLLLSLLIGVHAAHAGTLVVQTTVATEVVLDGLPVVRTYGPGSVSVPDVVAGQRKLVVFRDGESQTIEVPVPETGRVRLLVGAESLEVGAQPVASADAADGPAPVLELRGEKGQRFSVILDGKRHSVLGPDRSVRLEELGVGSHALELRSPDNLTIWAKGTIDLRPGDEVSLAITEGRPVEVFGRAEAWQPSR